MQLQFLPDEFSVCRLPPAAPIPEWANGHFFSITRTAEELSIVVTSDRVPGDIRVQTDFACFRVVSELDFDVIGVIAGISDVLAKAKISILSISTFDTDYFLLPATHKDDAKNALKQAGYDFD